MKKQTAIYVFGLLLLCANAFSQDTNKTFALNNNDFKPILQQRLEVTFKVPKQSSVTDELKNYIQSNAFSTDLRNGKWGNVVSFVIDGEQVITVSPKSSETEIVNFQSKIKSSLLVDPTLLLAINMLAAQVKEILEKATAAGLILEVEAANQVATVIDQARIAYRNELQLSINRISAAAQASLNSLQSVVGDLIKVTNENAREIERRALEISHNFPLSKHFPQIIKWNPSYTYPNSPLYLAKSKNWSRYVKYTKATSSISDDDKIHFELEGDFYDLPHKKFNATVEINGHTYVNNTKSSLDLGFEIPKSDLTYDPKEVSYNPVHIKIPYKKSVFLFFYKKDIAEFDLPIITLPSKVGTLAITTTVQVPSVITQSFKAGPFAQISDDDDIRCLGEHADLAIHCTPPEPGGWRIHPSSVTYEMIASEGDWFACGPDHSGQANACYSFSTIHHPWGTSGKIWFYITYLADKDALVNHNETTDIPINWEESHVFQLPDGATWKGTYTRFDGKVFEFAGPYEDNYIKVTQNMTTLTIKIKP